MRNALYSLWKNVRVKIKHKSNSADGCIAAAHPLLHDPYTLQWAGIFTPSKVPLLIGDLELQIP